MIRLVSIDPNLITNSDDNIRDRTWNWIAYCCGWSNRNLLAEIPDFSDISRDMLDGNSSKRFELFYEKMRTEKHLIRIPISDKKIWKEMAMDCNLLDYMLTQLDRKIEPVSKIRDFEDFINNLPDLCERFTLLNEQFLKYLDILVIGSNRIDIIDRYQPVSKLNPVFSHWINMFGIGGRFQFRKESRPRLIIHVSRISSDRAPSINVHEKDTAIDLLQRMNAMALTECFVVKFMVWEHTALHSRFILGDLGGVLLGESLNATRSAQITASALGNHLGIRQEYDLPGPHSKEFIKELSFENLII